jgi:hypothetical protein
MPSAGDLRAGGAYVEIYPDTSKLAATTESSVLQQLRGTFGRGSEFGMLTQTLRGAGPVLGLTLAGRELATLSSKALELNNAFRDGSKSVGQITDELLRSLPILGNVVSAVGDLNNLFRTNQDAIKEMADDAKAHADAVDRQKNGYDALKTTLLELKRIAGGESDTDKVTDTAEKGREAQKKATDEQLAANLKLRQQAIDTRNAARRNLGEGEGMFAEHGVAADRDRKIIADETARINKLNYERQQILAKAAEGDAKINEGAAQAQTRVNMQETEKQLRERSKATNQAADAEIERRKKIAAEDKKANDEQEEFAKRMGKLQDDIHDKYVAGVNEQIHKQLEAQQQVENELKGLVDSQGKARGTFNPLAGQSLQGGGGNINDILRKQHEEQTRIRQITERLWSSITGGSLGLIPG